MKRPASKNPARSTAKALVKRGAEKWDKPEPLYKEKFEQLLGTL